MKRTILSFVIVLALLLGVFGTAQAVTNGIPDGDQHPYVGHLIFTDGSGYWRCSGALLSPTVVLTAGHCTDGATNVWVTFDSHTDRGTLPLAQWLEENFITGTAYTHPDFCIGCGNGLVRFDQYDIGVVVLDEPVVMDTYAQLPQVGFVDTLGMGTPVDIVGYGVQERLVGGGPPVWVGTFTRYYAPAQLVASNNSISDEFIKLTANPSKGKGGTCFGDSGGPDLLGDTNIIIGVNAFVTNGNCAGVTYSQRVDLPTVLPFIQSFLN